MPRSAIVRRLAAGAAALALVLSASACASTAQVDVDLPAAATDPLPDEVTESVHAAVERAMAATGSTGAIVGVWIPGVGSLTEGIGTAYPDGPEVTAEMTFSATSTTRPMICDVLYGMTVDGLVSLDDDITEWTDDFPDLKGVTLGQLCDGTSGIGSFAGQLQSRWSATPSRVWNPRELASYGLGTPRQGAPGTGFHDSDTGYVLLGLALERASGKTAAELLDQYVFDPLDLNATALATKAPSGEPWLDGLRVGTTPEGAVDCAAPVKVAALSATAGYTAYGVVTDIADLGRYTQALATGARSYDSEDRFDAGLPASDGAPTWFTATGGAYQAGSLVGQAGAFQGQITAAFADRSTGATVAVVLNNASASATVGLSLAWELAAIVSKVPIDGGTASSGLPWTAEQYAAAVDQAAICPLP
ncbi:serine hydrolase domain-containing protein [Microbacterium sp.]|uniref:serine hydrolase domain-containing protein n=1 Tax=Microbacterium sp. TaxID=51671 RepID=UPI0039E726CD